MDFAFSRLLMHVTVHYYITIKWVWCVKGTTENAQRWRRYRCV